MIEKGFIVGAYTSSPNLFGWDKSLEKEFFKNILKNDFGIETIIPNESDRAIVHGIIYNDLHLNIDWKIDSKDVIISNKDNDLNDFHSCVKFK